MRQIVGAVGALILIVAACTSDGEPNSVGSIPRPTTIAGKSCSGDLETLIKRVKRGQVAGHGPEISVIPYEPHYVGLPTKPTHNGPWDYLGHVPLVVYGPGAIARVGEVKEPATMADLAPTTARLIGFDGFDALDGRVLDAVIEQARGRPRLVVTIVWDGAGDNMLAAHEDRWPFLKKLMRDGISFENMEIGSSPSVTPPVHATLGTGAWPRTHGIYSVKMRDDVGAFIDPWAGEDPRWLKVPTLADVYDAALDNEPMTGMTATVNWHLGMLGHGAALPGGDRDPAALINDVGDVYGNESFYELPAVADPAGLDSATARIDASDGRLDGVWRDHDLTDLSVRYASPATAEYQEDVLERLIATEDFGSDEIPDLMYVNFKQSDDAAHHWGMYSEEVGIVLKAQDDALERLVGFLDRTVGRNSWVLLLTADHGFMPYPEESGGWPIGGGELMRDVNRVAPTLDLPADPATRAVSTGLFLADDVDADQAGELAEWVVDYTVQENLQQDELPDQWKTRRNEPLFEVVMTEDGALRRSCS